MFNKDVVAPQRMKRRIENPRILLLDCPLEYKKGENQTNVEITKEEDWAALLKAEEDWMEKTCNNIIKFKPDVVITEKGLSDFAMTFLARAGTIEVEDEWNPGKVVEIMPQEYERLAGKGASSNWKGSVKVRICNPPLHADRPAD